MWRVLCQCATTAAPDFFLRSREARVANVQREREAEADRRKESVGPAAAVARWARSLQEDVLQGKVPGMQHVPPQFKGHPVRRI